MSGNLERRYRRVLRLLPGWYRRQWEQDMVAAFLDSWLTGDADADEYISKAAGPGWAETASVAGLAVRLYLGGAGGPRRHVAWSQAARNAVLAVMLLHAVTFLAWIRHWVGWIPGPAITVHASPPGIWVVGGYLIDYAWIVAFLTLVLGYYLTARITAALIMPLLALRVTGNAAWVPDFSGLCCILVAFACLTHTPWIRSRPGSGVWSLTLALLAAVAAADRLVSLNDYLHDPHLINVSLAALLILVVAAALVTPDAARARTATAPPPYPRAMAA
jgi:hypothetical protein